MILVRDIARGTNQDSLLNLTTYEDNFLFFNLIHSDHKKKLNRLDTTKTIARKADFAAAVAAKFAFCYAG